VTTALTEALVLTLDSERRMFTDGAVAFDDGGRIVVVGPTAQARDALGDSARIVECTGRVIAPGFVDRSSAAPLRHSYHRRSASIAGGRPESLERRALSRAGACRS
jgi:cytosine/adenosine deaminase-related metal-dependent hydrolase